MGDRKLLAVIRREYLERVRSKWFLISTLFGPVLFGALMFGPGLLMNRDRSGNGAEAILVLDATGQDLGTRVATALSGGIGGASASSPRVLAVTSGPALAEAESLATRAVVGDTVKGYLVLDAGTLASGKARYAGSNTTALFAMQRLDRAVQRELLAWKVEQSGVDPEVGRQLAATNVTIEAERLSKRGRGGSGQVNFFAGLIVALLLYMVTFVYGLNVLRGVLEEKQTRVAEVVVASIPAQRLLLGKVLGIGGVGLTQVVIWIGTSVALWQARAPMLARLGVDAAPFALPDVTATSLALLLAFFLLGFLLYASLFAAVGAMVNSEQEAQQAQMPVVLLLVSTILLAQGIVMEPESTFARIVSMLPHAAPIVMPLRMTVTTVPTSELAGALVSVALGALASIWLAGRIYRVGLLMYGKRPTLREVVTWIGRR
jgi:ABC-2 type transport system permease protein